MEYPYYLINKYSFKDVDDLGSYYSCNDQLKDIAQYYSMNVNITNVPFNFRIGLCLPVQCSQDMMDEVAYRINMALIDMFNFLGGFDELYFIKDYNIGLGYNFIEPRNALNDIREGKRTPAIIIACVFFLALLLCLIATFINTYPRIWRKISNLNTKDPYYKMKNQFLKKKLMSLENHRDVASSIQRQSLDENEEQKETRETTGAFLQIPQTASVVYDSEETRIRTVKRSFSYTHDENSGKQINNTKDSQRIDLAAFKKSKNPMIKQTETHDMDMPKILLENQSTFESGALKYQEAKNGDLELEEVETYHNNLKKFVDIFSFVTNTEFLFKKNTEIKYGAENDLEIVNGIIVVLTIWGLAISTPYYLLAAPLYNVWRFLVLFGHYLVVAVFSGHCIPELLILLSTFLGFVFLERKYQEHGYRKRKFISVTLYILLKKYIKFFILIMVGSIFTYYISPFLFNYPNYYTSGISYESCTKDWWYNILMVGNFAPTSYYGMSGCMPWMWILSGIFQFWCLIPLIVMLYDKNRLVTYALLFFFSVFSIFYTMYLVYQNNFKVGVL